MNRKTLAALATGAALGAICALWPPSSMVGAQPAATDSTERQRLERIVAESAARSAAATARHIAQTQLKGADTGPPPSRPSSLALRPTRRPQLQASAAGTASAAWSRPHTR